MSINSRFARKLEKLIILSKIVEKLPNNNVLDILASFLSFCKSAIFYKHFEEYKLDNRAYFVV